MAFYRFTRSCRHVIVNYLKSQLQGGTNHFDGTDWVEIPSPITVSDSYQYDPRKLPAVVTDIVTGGTKSLAFNQEVASYVDTNGIYGDKGITYTTYGGRGDFDINVHCAANDHETMEQLTDVVAFLMIIGMGWIYYNRHIFMREVRFGGDGVDNKISQEPVYYGNLVVPATADWRLIVPRETVKRINPDLDIVTPDDPFDDPNSLMPGTITPIDPGIDLSKSIVITQESDIQEKFKDDLPLRPMRSR
jgi:hypothetical protein